MKVTLYVMLAAALASGLAACYPNNLTDAQAEDFDVVTTIYDTTAQFSTIVTFALPDSVVHFVGSEGDTLSHDFDDLILSQIREHVLALGYTETTDPATTPPDVVVQVGAVSTTEVGYLVYDWWGYWGWYYPWYPTYGAGWGVYYPSYAVPYSYESGTVLIGMIDRRRQDLAQQQIPTIWIAGLTGVLTGAGVNTGPRLTSAIDQAFAQSPYLSAQ